MTKRTDIRIGMGISTGDLRGLLDDVKSQKICIAQAVLNSETSILSIVGYYAPRPGAKTLTSRRWAGVAI